MSLRSENFIACSIVYSSHHLQITNIYNIILLLRYLCHKNVGRQTYIKNSLTVNKLIFQHYKYNKKQFLTRTISLFEVTYLFPPLDLPIISTVAPSPTLAAARVWRSFKKLDINLICCLFGGKPTWSAIISFRSLICFVIGKVTGITMEALLSEAGTVTWTVMPSGNRAANSSSGTITKKT